MSQRYTSPARSALPTALLKWLLPHTKVPLAKMPNVVRKLGTADMVTTLPVPELQIKMVAEGGCEGHDSIAAAAE
ncbi:UNVERIFIED_CONTAM: hypothetical protein K2H54_054844 [Gekko kuhli]